MACSEIEGCKGTFWKKQDATCWWSDHDHVADLDAETTDPCACTNAPGYVYMTVRRESPESCAEAKEKCLEKSKSLEGDVSRLETELDRIRNKLSKTTRYVKKQPSVYGSLLNSPPAQSFEQCSAICALADKCKWAHWAFDQKKCHMYQTDYKHPMLNSIWDMVVYI
ncbi:hypothetical protein AFLA70_419g001151 [Aspergillus flavus AF70]|nr:hypothetical protein AFLA70_419g001151 [Aspergillus flavus AF70]